jgi:hypothetical protein
MGFVLLDAHAAAAAVALLPPPELVVDELLIDGNARGKPADQRYERLSVALACCEESKHESLIISV